MEVKLIENQQNWNNWIKNTQKNVPFAQSWTWGDILIAEGKNVERLAVVENDEILAQAQVVYSNLPLGMKYAFCPKGPLVSQEPGARSQEIFDCLYSYLKEQGCIFFRIEPAQELRTQNLELRTTKDINPSATLILDLEKSEEELLQNMHSKTRYNIRLAEKKGVEIKQEKNLSEFLRLMKKTGERDKFRLHPDEHYKEILNSAYSLQLTAYIMEREIGDNRRAIASAVFIKFGDTFTYLYGASDYDKRKLMAPNLLQWEGIKLGKSLGYKFYDFFGIAPVLEKSYQPIAISNEVKEKSLKDFEYDKQHQYAGVTRFKLGFGGEYHKDPGTFDLVINKQKYFLYKFLRKVRRYLAF